MILPFLLAPLLAPLLVAAPMGGAVAFQDIGGLDRAVAAFTSRPVGAEGGARTPIDPRLRLAQCSTVALAWRTEAHDAVVVSCSGPDWRIFVPVIRPAGAPPPAASARPAVVAAAVKAEPVIRRGDPVVIEAGSNGFSISREGVAMGDAPPAVASWSRSRMPRVRSRRSRSRQAMRRCPAGANDGWRIQALRRGNFFAKPPSQPAVYPCVRQHR